MRWNLFPEKQYRTSDRLARIPSKVIFTILLQVDVKRLMDKNCPSSFSFLKHNRLLLANVRRSHYWSQQSRTFFFKGFSAKQQKKPKKAANYSVIEQNALSDKHPKMTGQNDRQTRVWPVKPTIRPDIVRWPAVILSPGLGSKWSY